MNNSFYNFDDVVARLPQFEFTENIYNDIYSVVDLIFAKVFVIINIEMELQIVSVALDRNMCIFNGEEKLEFEEGHVLRFQLDDDSINKLAEYFYEQYYV
jgi:hypothetical protein